MAMLECAGMVRVLSPVTLSLEVHWDEVSELSVAIRPHRDKDTLIMHLSECSVSVWRKLLSLYSVMWYVAVVVALYRVLATPSGNSR